MARRNVRKNGDDWDGIEDVDRLATWARWIITIIGGTLAAIFTWLQIKDVPLGVLVESTTPGFLIKAALIPYYFCWIGGATFDVAVQQRVYVADKNRGRLAIDTAAVVAGFFIVALLLLWTSSNEKVFGVSAEQLFDVPYEKIFGLVLTAFVVVNIIAWRHIVRRIKPAIKLSRERFEQKRNFFRLEQLELVTEYMTGRWQMRRFYGMLAMLAIINFVNWNEGLRLLLAQMARNIPGLSDKDVSNLIFGALILLFVFIAEAWIWIKRVNIRTALLVINRLKEKYEINPRRDRS